MLAKSAYDYASIKSVSAYAITFNGNFCGKIVANHGESQVTATVCIYGGPRRGMESTTGVASGYGYDKLSAAIWDAFHRADGGIWKLKDEDWQRILESENYVINKVV